MEGGLSTVQSWPCRDDDDGDADGVMKTSLLGTFARHNTLPTQVGKEERIEGRGILRAHSIVQYSTVSTAQTQ